jgi:hypothetical protein
MKLKRLAAFAAACCLAVALTLIVGAALAQEPTPQQTIAAQQTIIQRANSCVDAYTNWITAEQRLAAASQQIAALQARVAELTPKRKEELTK